MEVTTLCSIPPNYANGTKKDQTDAVVYTNKSSTSNESDLTEKKILISCQQEEIFCSDHVATTPLQTSIRSVHYSTTVQLNQSVRSQISTSTASYTTHISSSVHSNLMRSHHNKDPLKYYTVLSMLGSGSMGSVAKVKKKDTAIGGSARPDFVKETHGACYQYCNTHCFPLLHAFLDRFLPRKGHFIRAPPHKVSTPITDSFLLTTSSKQSNLESTIRTTTHGHIDDEIDRDVSQSIALAKKSSSNMIFNKEETTSQDFSNPASSTSKSYGTGSKRNKKILRHQLSSMVHYGSDKEMYYALKSIHLDRCTSEEFKLELKNEINILKQLDHPNIVKAMETYNYRNRVYIVLELCQGGDLYARDPYTESDAKKIIFCLLNAVAYLHSKQIVHRDLKFENICFADNSPESEIRIIDFGLSQKYAKNEHLHDAVGTCYTMAPELLRGDYDAKVDLWSVGVISFSLLSSSLPFFGKDRVAVMKKIIKGKYRFHSERWKSVSDDGKQFVRDLLQQDPLIRPAGLDAMEHEWFRHDFDCNISSAYTKIESEQMDRLFASMQAFAAYPALKQIALMVVAYQSTSEEIGFLRKLFRRFDRLEDGEISLIEFRDALLENYSYTDEEIEALFHGIDIDGTGKVHYVEFLAATIEAHGEIGEVRLAEAFDRLDSDSSGFISVENMKVFLGKDIPDSYVEKVIEEADIVHDNRISYEEFLNLWSIDSDDTISQTRTEVQNRRRSRSYSKGGVTNESEPTSPASLLSGASGDDLSSIVSDVPDLTEESGQFYFSQRKFQSIRKVKIDNMKDVILNDEGKLW